MSSVRRDCSRVPLPGTPVAEAVASELLGAACGCRVAPRPGLYHPGLPAASRSQSRLSDKWPVRREDGGWGQNQQEKGRERWQNATRRASLSRRGERPLAGVARREHPRVTRPAPIPRHRSNSGGAALGPRPRPQVGAGTPSHPREESGLEVPWTGAGRVTRVSLATVPGKSRGLSG